MQDKDKQDLLTEAQSFNRIQYQNFLCSALFLIGKDFDEVVKECQTGIDLCTKFKYEPLKAECTRILGEFKSIQIKGRAKGLNTNAMELREKEST